MIKYLSCLLLLLNINTTFGATGQDCKNEIVTQLTQTINSSKIDVKSPKLQDDVTALLSPKFENIIENNPKCKDIHDDLLAFDKTGFSVSKDGHIFDIEFDFTSTFVGKPPVEVPEEIMESVLPWYGILVVKKGSLDKYANADVPIISTEYMKKNKDEFYPANSNRALGMRRACTHGNHTANDKDVVNRAAHITMGEKDSFWSGNDYYVYDGEDVYWGWAQAIGEVALAIVTLGISAEATAANAAVKGTSGAVKASNLTRNSTKVAKAADLASKATPGAAGAASRADAVKALGEAGVKVNSGIRASSLKKIGTALSAYPEGQWATSLAQPWKLVKPGITTLNPKNAEKVYGKGVTWGKRIKTAAIQTAASTLGIELIKAFGYSSSSFNYKDLGIKFNSFGLLSLDDLEGHENDISHGTWLSFEEVGSINQDDTLNEALRFAEEFQEDMDTINTEDPQCNVDIYVVQPAVSNPTKMGKREVYYIIQNPGSSLSVQTKQKAK